MTPQQKIVLYEYRTSVAWTLVGAFLVSFGFKETPQWVTTVAFGSMMPTAALGMRILTRRVRFKSFFLTVLVHAVFTSVLFSAAFYFALLICIVGSGAKNPISVTNAIVERREIGISMAIAVLVAFTITLIMKMSNKLGPGVLVNWMTGKYHDPKEETRLFMFLDIKDSTTLAEQLGNLRFSALVRDFFQDMSVACFETKAEVSHYIGDEAVISWRPDRGKRNANCIRFFFGVQHEIAKRSNYYRKRYGLVPGFKAGLHIGAVVATEVGEAKSEIVFHGDVMNTTARIQGLCGLLDTDFLISEEARTFLESELGGYSTINRGEQILKGKAMPVLVHSIEPPD